MYLLEIDCNSPVISTFLYPVHNILILLMIICPILLIISYTYTFIMMAMNPDEKKHKKRLTNSSMALIIVFFITTLVNVVVSLCGSNFDLTACINERVQTFGTGEYISIDDRKPTKIITEGGYESGNHNGGGNNTGTGEITTITTTDRVGVQNILSAASRVSKIGIDGKWSYLSTGKGEHTLEESIQSRHTSCANFVSIILQEAGALPKGYTFWSDTSANIRCSDKVMSAIKSKFNIINVNYNSNFKLEAGDVCLIKGHTALYAGNGMWYDAGRGSTYEVASGSTFKNFYRKNANSVGSVKYVFRLK